jgi:hypothetical protein
MGGVGSNRLPQETLTFGILRLEQIRVAQVIQQIGVVWALIERGEVVALGGREAAHEIRNDAEAVMRPGMTGIFTKHALVKSCRLFGAVGIGFEVTAPKVFGNFGFVECCGVERVRVGRGSFVGHTAGRQGCWLGDREMLGPL